MSDEYNAILQRFQQLEALQQRPTVDQHLIQRTGPVDLQPYEEFYNILPGAEDDFFRSPLSENARRKFLSYCPTDMDRRYRAPSVQRNINVGPLTKRFDHQLADIQYRLSGITRPIDLMAHNLAQGHQPSIPDATDFIRTIHSVV